MKLAQQTQTDLKSIGIQCGTVTNWSVNSRAKARGGLCRCIARDIFDIQIAEALLQDHISDQAVKNTITHELLHTIPDCLKHTGKWKMLAAKVNARMPGYNNKRTESYEDKGVQPQPREIHCRYLLKCSGCGAEIPRQKKSTAVEHPERYRCHKCGGNLIPVYYESKFTKGALTYLKKNQTTVEYIAECLRSAGYDPYAQILGYMDTGNDAFITRHGDARDLIKTIDPAELDRYIADNKS